MDAYDADVLIYATHDDDRGRAIRRTLRSSHMTTGTAGVGSTLLVFETMVKPVRLDDEAMLIAHGELLDLLDLLPCDLAIAEAATEVGARYGLKTGDAVHLATAINAGADRFITNNRRDFTKDIEEIDITYPEDLQPSTA